MSTRETVECETPASLATSTIVAGPSGLFASSIVIGVLVRAVLVVTLEGRVDNASCHGSGHVCSAPRGANAHVSSGEYLEVLMHGTFIAATVVPMVLRLLGWRRVATRLEGAAK